MTLSALFVAMWIHAGTLDVRGDTGAFDASCPTAMAGDDDDERRMTPSAMADDGDGDDDDSLASDDDPGDGPEAFPCSTCPSASWSTRREPRGHPGSFTSTPRRLLQEPDARRPSRAALPQHRVCLGAHEARLAAPGRRSPEPRPWSRGVLSMKLDLRLDLGSRRLLPVWRALLRPKYLREDLVAGLTVASIAVPLSLAIALASGVPPALGITTAVVSAVVAALFGGTPLAVTGPAAALAVLVAAAVQAHGLGGLVIIGLIAGILQIATGVLGLGRFVRLVPLPVVEGVNAGIGAIILIGQLPRVLGLPPPEVSGVVDVLTHIGELFHQARPASALIALSTVALVFGLPRIHPLLPAPLLAVAVPTAVVAALGIETATLGAVPFEIPLPRLPSLPAAGAWGSLLGTAALVYALASLASLLSSSAVDKLARGERHDPDQEMIGQGLGNVASALVGGLPVTGVIARSSLNVQAGARTRRAAIFHALVVLLVVSVLAPVMARIPLATLAGLLVAVAARMLDPRKFVRMARACRDDAVVAALTFAVMVFTDLVEGVQWGVVAALAVAAVRLGQMRLHLHDHDRAATRIELTGPLTFLASLQIEALRGRIDEARPGTPIVLDAGGATALDASGVRCWPTWCDR